MSLEQTLLQFGVPAKYARAARAQIGVGTEGAVYDLGNGLILKVNVKSRGQAITKIAARANRYPWTAKTLDAGLLHPKGMSPRGFWYVSEKLYPIDARERRLLNVVGVADWGKAKGVTTPKASNTAVELALKAMPAELRRVVEKAKAAGYHDFHGGNVMRTATGAYRIIDVESFRPVKRVR